MMTNLDEKIKVSKEKLNSISNKKSREYSEELERLGLYYYENDEIDNAISTIQKSLELHPTINKGYKTLMKIYNNKRAQAAKNGNKKDVIYWLDKMAEMRNIAKRGTILR